MDQCSDEGAAVYLGLLFCAVFFDAGEKGGRHTCDPGGEISFGRALWAAFVGLICTAIAGGILDADVEDIVFIGAGVAGAVSLIIQATGWWRPSSAGRAVGQPQQPEGLSLREAPPVESALSPPPPEPPSPQAGTQPVSHVVASHGQDACMRWGITRAFWGLVAFILMGGAIVTFLYPLVAAKSKHHDITASIVMCTAFASFMIFALRKTTPLKRDGFWRETLRPFLISLTLFGIGATITGIASEWDHWVVWHEYRQRCVADEGRVALIAGLVMCSILFLGLTLFTGRKRQPKPFLQLGSSARNGTESGGVEDGASERAPSEPPT